MGELPRYRTLIHDSARWDGFVFRDDDIVISTPAKCGTTWTQMICALLILQDPALPAPLTELSPWLDVQTRKIEDVFAQLEAQQHRRFIKSHTPLDGIPFDERVTYLSVGRDPRDVAVSWDHHASNMRLDAILGKRAEAVGVDDLEELMPDLSVVSEDPVERFWRWVDSDDPSGFTLRATLHHLDTFWQARDRDNIVLLHYADLTHDLEGQMRALARRLDIDVPEETWPDLVKAASFEHMRDRADELAPQVTDDFWHSSGNFFHSGTSEQWRALFEPGDEKRYEDRVRALASDDLLEWVHRS
jgi:aryl sulfotransferase